MSRFLCAFVLLAAALPGDASAAGIVRKGVYHGIWHTDKVTFTIEKVGRDGEFSGVMHFDPKSRAPGVVAAFTGKVGPRDSITIHRTEYPQTAKAGAPKSTGKFYIWSGSVTGKGLDKPYSFELKIPR
jgi:hypothetical protein